MGKNSFLRNLVFWERPRMTTGFKIVVMGLLLSVGWGPATSGAGECPDLQGESETTKIVQMNIRAGGEIPAIDAATPETTETATFSMG
jgi:hypothetical protein